MNGLLIVNPRSGRADPSVEELAAEARRLGLEVRALREREDPADVARSSDAPVLGIAGGDGSLASVVHAALERDVPFVCIPFGTRNHFARDLGLDRADPLATLQAFAGAERRIDVGYADERLFLNNVSLGVYAQLVRRREHHRRRREAFARVRAWTTLLTHREQLGIRVDGDAVETRILLVANNAYGIAFPTIGARQRLDEGSCTSTSREANASANASSSMPPPAGSRRRSTASPTCCRRRSTSGSRRARYACSYPTASASTAG